MPSNWWHRFEEDLKKVSSNLRVESWGYLYAKVYYKGILLDFVIPDLMHENSYEYSSHGEEFFVLGCNPALSSIRKKLFALNTEAGRKEINQMK